MVQWYTQRSFCIWPGMMTSMPLSRQCPSSVSPGYSLALRSFAYVQFPLYGTNFDGKLQCSNYLHRHRVGWSMYHTQCWSQCSTKRFSPIFLLHWEEHNINRKQGHNTISVLNTSKFLYTLILGYSLKNRHRISRSFTKPTFWESVSVCCISRIQHVGISCFHRRQVIRWFPGPRHGQCLAVGVGHQTAEGRRGAGNWEGVDLKVPLLGSF